MVVPDAAPVTIIAEAGVNHNGDLSVALKLVDAAVSAGADVVKFQTFSADDLASRETPKVAYQAVGAESETHWEMLKRLELSEVDALRIKGHCDDSGIEFMSTPYGLADVAFLDSIGVRRFKIASADIVDVPLHNAVIGTGRPCIVSTGMASRVEVERIVELYVAGNVDLTLLHTTSAYPTQMADAHLRHMTQLSADHGVPVGFSDHTQSEVGAILAVGLGARVIEKHLTLDRSDLGPDHRASADPREFSRYVSMIRMAESALGTMEYRRTPEEEQMALTSRKSLHSAHRLEAGASLTSADVVLRRPGSGLLWRDLPRVLGRRVLVDIPAGTMIAEGQFSNE